LRFGKIKTLHFVGIGGIGMSGIAEMLHNEGFVITGSDLVPTEVTDHLREIGIKVSFEHRAENVGDSHAIVISSAVGDDNPEVVAARDAKIPVIRRAEMLGELMRTKFGIAIAGTHGKTTTTSIVGHVLTECGLDPTVIVGEIRKNEIRMDLRQEKQLRSPSPEAFPHESARADVENRLLDLIAALERIAE